MWLITNTYPAYGEMLKGEIEPEFINLLKIIDYWAALGTKQAYSQDLIIKISGDNLLIRQEKFRTYIHQQGYKPLEQYMRSGMWADNFFIAKDGSLKKTYSKFYDDVKEKFVRLVKNISDEL